MEEDSADLLALSDLLRRGRPLTGASSLPLSVSPPSSSSSSSSSSKPQKKPRLPSPTPPPSAADANHKPKILTPLNRPSILIGTLTLPTETLKCPNKNCFQFSDDSFSSICCDILNFSVRTIGTKIRVLSWNFIPSKHCSGGGFLEIITWRFLEESSNSNSKFPLVSTVSLSDEDNSNSKARYRVHGPVESVSPVSLVPCSVGAGRSQILRGFVARIMACECKLCPSKESVPDFHGNAHSFTSSVFVYFCGSSSCWHPVITKLVGHGVALSGLKKKLIVTENDVSELMFVTAQNSAFHVARSCKEWSPALRNAIKGKGECGCYTGVVKGVYMQGMVIEMDTEVWLLLTDQLLIPPHSLRVGAIICVKNAHFINPKFSWTRLLILGGCFRTSVTIHSFSPLEAGCHKILQLQCRLGKFIDSLQFSSKLWALLVISSFRKKFSGILSEKEILGSKHKEGLAEVFSRTHLSSSGFQARHGVLREFCKHDSVGCGCDPYSGDLKLMAPISTFLDHCKAMWMNTTMQLENNCQIICGNSDSRFLSCKRQSLGQASRKVFPSRDIGVSLLGNLQMSSSSGRLQLIDATGCIDVMIPDLPSTWNTRSICEVVDYSIVIEGMAENVDHLRSFDKSLSCRHIFHCIRLAREMKISVYAHFYLQAVIFKNLPFYPWVPQNDDLEELRSGRFHLIRVVHKYPVLQKFQGDPVIIRGSSVFTEAVVLPWDLFLSGKEPLEHYDCKNYQADLCNKKHETDKVSSSELASGLEGDHWNSQRELITGASFCYETAEWRCGGSSHHEIPCLATIRSGNGQNLFISGKLCCLKCNVKVQSNYKPCVEKVLLEFNSESFFKYQLMQIGRYYIIKHHTEESFCNVKDYDNVCIHKVLITSRIHLWSLQFSSKPLTNASSSESPSQNDSSLRNKGIKNQVELLVHRSIQNSPEFCPDVYLHLSAHMISVLETELNKTKCHMKPATILEETSGDSLHIASASILSSRSFGSRCLFPEGSLVSVIGHVIALHGFDYNPSNGQLNCISLEDDHTRSSRENTGSFCIHVLVDTQMVNIFSSLAKYAYPVGFGPGVEATFHRILKVRYAIHTEIYRRSSDLTSLRQTNRLMLMPTSFVEINSASVAYEPCPWKSSTCCSPLYVPSNSYSNNVSSRMISEFNYCTSSKPMQFNCRVVAVSLLVLERKRKQEDLQFILHPGPDLVDIPLAGFVLDDGSSLCCCWANAERAATLLRLHEKLPQRAFKSRVFSLKHEELDKSYLKTTVFHLKRILRKHRRVTVKNYGSMLDSSYQDLTVSVGPDTALSSLDENFLKFVIFNACFSTNWTVVAGLMDSNAIKLLEEAHHIEEGMALPAMQNVWAMNVSYTNILTEARNIIQDLLQR